MPEDDGVADIPDQTEEERFYAEFRVYVEQRLLDCALRTRPRTSV
jgi:hypothetical protein